MNEISKETFVEEGGGADAGYGGFIFWRSEADRHGGG